MTGSSTETPSPQSDAPQLTAEQAAAAAARAAVPDAADGYAWSPSDKLKGFVNIEASDPAILALQEHAKSAGWTQGQYQDVLSSLEVFAEKGLLEPLFDPAAEVAKLGANGAAQMQEQESFLTSLKGRGELSDEGFGELMTLVPTAAGTRALAELRKVMGPAGIIQTPQVDVTPAEQMMAEARAERLDPRYNADPKYRRAADLKWEQAWKDGAR